MSYSPLSSADTLQNVELCKERVFMQRGGNGVARKLSRRVWEKSRPGDQFRCGQGLRATEGCSVASPVSPVSFCQHTMMLDELRLWRTCMNLFNALAISNTSFSFLIGFGIFCQLRVFIYAICWVTNQVWSKKRGIPDRSKIDIQATW